MPKEYTHWWLAEEARKRLEAPAGVSEAVDFRRLVSVLDRHRALFLLGAVGPDYLFYYLAGPALGAFKKAALVLHGSDGGDTLAVLARRAETRTAGLPEGELAFLYGYACHVAADAVFHPLVLHYVGKGSPKNQYDHHVFESVLDLYVRYGLKPEGVPATLAELTGAMTLDRGEFLDLLGYVSFGGGAYDKGALAKCLKRYEFLQALFWTFPGRIAARLAGGLARGLRNFEPSFYQCRFRRFAAAFAAELSYRHPVTGTEKKGTILSLRNEMTSLAAEYAAVFERALEPDRVSSGAAAAEVLRAIRGPNLETGLFGDGAAPETIRHTAAAGIAGLFGETYAAFKLEDTPGGRRT